MFDKYLHTSWPGHVEILIIHYTYKTRNCIRERYNSIYSTLHAKHVPKLRKSIHFLLCFQVFSMHCKRKLWRSVQPLHVMYEEIEIHRNDLSMIIYLLNPKARIQTKTLQFQYSF